MACISSCGALRKKAAVKDYADAARNQFCSKEGEPKPVQPQPRENKAERNKQHDHSNDCEQRTFCTGAYGLKEHRKSGRHNHWQKTYSDKAEADLPDLNDARV